jgi:CDGSH-type Zn-finger protein
MHSRQRVCPWVARGVSTPDKRPWIEPDNADTDELADVIMACPTGALHFERTDDGPEETVPDENSVTVVPDGPLYLHGDIEITTTDDETLLADTRVALCRCGLSANKPLCDNSHVEADFQADSSIAEDHEKTENVDSGGTLQVIPTPDGPVLLDGAFELHSTDDESTIRDTDAALCRCGGSQNKPFCDGTHAEISFSSETETDQPS